jgi:hypothetical protein
VLNESAQTACPLLLYPFHGIHTMLCGFRNLSDSILAASPASTLQVRIDALRDNEDILLVVEIKKRLKKINNI